MSYAIWVIIFYGLGTLYLVDWMAAQSKCTPKEKWIMFTPIWPFYLKPFDESGKKICRRVRIYFGLGALLYIFWQLGFVVKP